MKTSEFIKKIETLGYEIINKESGRYFVVTRNGYYTLVLGNEYMYMITTAWDGFKELSDKEKKELVEIVWEYVSTPIEQRAEEKVYQLRHKWVRDSFPHYLNKESCGFSISSGLERLDKHTKATAKQWEEWTGRTWEQLLQEFDDAEVAG